MIVTTSNALYFRIPWELYNLWCAYIVMLDPSSRYNIFSSVPISKLPVQRMAPSRNNTAMEVILLELLMTPVVGMRLAFR